MQESITKCYLDRWFSGCVILICGIAGTHFVFVANIVNKPGCVTDVSIVKGVRIACNWH